ncbi:MAG TPA: DUF1559 domain-containing protein [Candidatus Nitrosotalea sp.]|nr:DUF1559 domain-containing protein [Candidatus Nitrosotalea sp.]
MKHPPPEQTSAPAPKTGPGFTLVELLVAISIIALLAALLIPAVSKSKETARSVACMNNLHQIALASMTYTMDFNGQLPSFWDWLHTKPNDLTTGRLYPYLKSRPIYLCPTDKLDLTSKARSKSVSLTGMPSGIRDYSFAMNCEICHATDLAAFLEPSRTVLYMEGALRTNDFTGVVGPGMGASQTLAFRHRNRGHLVMADLRVETMDRKAFSNVGMTKRFWLPTNDATGPGASSLH